MCSSGQLSEMCNFSNACTIHMKHLFIYTKIIGAIKGKMTVIHSTFYTHFCFSVDIKNHFTFQQFDDEFVCFVWGTISSPKSSNTYSVFSHEGVITVNLYTNEIWMGSTYRRLLMRCQFLKVLDVEEKRFSISFTDAIISVFINHKYQTEQNVS